MGTIIVGIILAAGVLLAAGKIIKDKKNGKSCSCSGDCGSCGGQCR